MGANNGASEPSDAFDLDALARDAGFRSAFRFRLAGRWFELVDPRELPWQLQRAFAEVDLEKFVPHMFARAEDRDAFMAVELPLWKLNRLIEEWLRHTRVDVGESEASPPSSNRTARRSRPTSRTTTTSGSRTSRRDG